MPGLALEKTFQQQKMANEQTDSKNLQCIFTLDQCFPKCVLPQFTITNSHEHWNSSKFL